MLTTIPHPPKLKVLAYYFHNIIPNATSQKNVTIILNLFQHNRDKPSHAVVFDEWTAQGMSIAL